MVGLGESPIGSIQSTGVVHKDGGDLHVHRSASMADVRTGSWEFDKPALPAAGEIMNGAGQSNCKDTPK